MAFVGGAASQKDSLSNFYGDPNARDEAAAGIQGAGETAYGRAKQTGAEADQYAQSFDLGKLLEQVFKGQQGLGSLPQGYQTSEQQLQGQGALGSALYNQTLAQAQDPDKYFQDTLQPELMQAQDTINSYYQKRGLLNSGLAIESLGRAGVDLAIKSAQARMQARQQSLNNALQISQYGNTINQNNLSGLANLYSTQQNAGLNSLSRQAGGATNAAQYQAYPYQAQLGDFYGKQSALAALPGQFISAGGQAATAGAGGA